MIQRNIKLIFSFSALFILLGCNRDYTLYVIFDRVDGLYEKSKVQLNGVEVGTVGKMSLTGERKVLVTLSMNKTTHIPVGSKFSLLSTDFMGTKCVNISLDSTKAKTYLNEDTVYGYYKDPAIDTALDKVDSAFAKNALVLIDSLANSLPLLINNRKNDNTDDFAPGLLLFALFALGLVLICIGVGIALTFFALLIIFGLVSIGILSTSIIVGLNKKSFAKGFKTFLILSSSIGGTVIGMAGFFALNTVLHWLSTKIAVTIGAGLGLLIGFGIGFLAFFVLQRLTTYFKRKLNIHS